MTTLIIAISFLAGMTTTHLIYLWGEVAKKRKASRDGFNAMAGLLKMSGLDVSSALLQIEGEIKKSKEQSWPTK